MNIALKQGSQDVTVNVFVIDAGEDTFPGLTGLAFDTQDLTCYYVRHRSAAVSLPLITQTPTGAHADGGFVEISAANMPGMYRLDLPDAAFLSGSDAVTVMLKGADSMITAVVEIQLTELPLNMTTSTAAPGSTVTIGASVVTDRDVTVSARVFDPETSKWWDGAAWTTDEASAQYTLLIGVGIDDPYSDRYAAPVTVPWGEYVLEYVLGGTLEVLAEESIFRANGGDPWTIASACISAIAGSTIATGILENNVTLTRGLVTRITRGDAKTFTFNFGSDWDCTGGKRIFLTLKASRTDQSPLVDKEATITVAASASGYVTLSDADTAVVGKYWYEYERRDADGTSNPGTIQRGTLIIEQDARQ
jgi:hypothetical protein